MENLEKYIAILKEWNKKINLVQKNSIDDILQRHIQDSLQISNFLEKNERIIDIGSGAGFPGIILALNGFNNIILCEKCYKKSVFLSYVKNRLRLNVEILNRNIYNLKLQNYTCLSRAFGSLKKLLEIMENLQSPKGIFHKGERYLIELQEAKESFNFEYEIFESITHKNSVILKISNIGRK